MTNFSQTSTAQLGTLLAEHRRMTSSKFVYTVLPILCLLLGAGVIVGGVLSRALGTFIFSVLFALVFLGPGAWLWLTNRRERDLLLQVFADGFSYAANGRQTAARWDEILEVFEKITAKSVNGAHVGTFYQYTIILKNSAPVKTSERLGNLEAFGQTIRNEVFERRFPEAWQRYCQGEAVRFGKFELSQQGINNGRETLPWSQIKEVAVKQGIIRLSRQGGGVLSWGQAPAAKVPNYFVMTALADRIMQAQANKNK